MGVRRRRPDFQPSFHEPGHLSVQNFVAYATKFRQVGFMGSLRPPAGDEMLSMNIIETIVRHNQDEIGWDEQEEDDKHYYP